MKNRSARAFTLIELLVVIAVIAVLAAILFPVFAQVREKARQAACSSNEMQLSLGVLMYAQDHDEALPPVQIDYGAREVLWPELVDPYVKNEKIRVCPSDSQSKLQSYGLNEMGFVDLTDDPPPTVKTLSAFQTPSATVMMSELGTRDDIKTASSDSFTLPAPDGPDDPPTPGIITDPADARPAARHFGRANVAFMDGHVKALRLDQFYTSQTPRDKWFCTDPNDAAACKAE